jgi:hypothetical protein
MILVRPSLTPVTENDTSVLSPHPLCVFLIRHRKIDRSKNIDTIGEYTVYFLLPN